MITLTLDEIAAATSGRLAADTDGGTEITGAVTIDSRRVTPGGLFVALPGERVDGHDFAARAVAAGAAAVLATRDTGVPAVLVEDAQAALGQLAHAVLDRLPDTTVLGITGSSGKTSTKDLIKQLSAKLFSAEGETVATAASYNNEIGLPLTVLGADERTANLILEMGARGIGHIAQLCAVAAPSVAVITNVGSAHLGEFGTRERTALAKGELVEALPSDGVAVLNADDDLVSGMAGRTTARVLLFGRAPHAEVRASEVTLDGAGRAAFVLHAGGGSAPARLRLVGEHQVSNALAAAAATVGLAARHRVTVSASEIADVLSAAEPLSSWRMEVHDRPDGVTIINDAYNANPESTREALRTLAVIARGRPDGARTWAVLGEMAELGESAAELHESVGRLAARLGVDRLVVVGEGAAPIHDGAVREGSWGAESVKVQDPEAAVAVLREQLRPGDVVLVKASHSVGLESVAHAVLGRDDAGEGEDDA